ncbi:phospholipase A2 group XV-like [Sitodiplosis mosellana]|uniref:phospholipase A2 group XV-like n=1 Tax=Sitodiplosis mosellana TaxID=263140 RepID=UPI002444DC87|nr:phospholipase A2 group XV-like [Sitodiplosis mosellana]
MRKDLQPYGSLMAPGVEMHCLFGNSDDGVFESLNFGKGLNANPIEVKGEGDGTVNRRSLIGCNYWQNTPAQFGYAIHQQEIPDAEHYDILSDSRLIDYITRTLCGVTGYTEVRRKNKTHKNNKIMRIRLF